MMSPSAAPRRYAFVPILALAALFFAVAPVYWRAVERPAEGRRVALGNTDLYQRVHPALYEGARRALAGDFDLACDARLFGTFQPICAVMLHPDRRFALACHASLCLALMAFGAALFARTLGVRYSSAIFAGVVYAGSGMAASCMTLPGVAATLAWTPFTFWAAAEWTYRPNWAFVVLWGVAGGLMFQPDTLGLALSLVLFAAAFGVFRILTGPGPRMRLLTGIAITVLIAVSLSAVHWCLGVVRLAIMQSARTAEAAPWYAVPDPNGAGILLRQVFAGGGESLWEFAYLGAAALAVLPAALFHTTARRDALFFLAAGILLFGGAATATPETATLLLMPGLFAVTVVAGLGVDALFASGRDFRSPMVWGPVAVALAAAIALLYVGDARFDGRLVVIMALAATYLLIRPRRAAALCTVLLTIVTLVDLAAANASTLHAVTRTTKQQGAAGAALLPRIFRVPMEQVTWNTPDGLTFSIPENPGDKPQEGIAVTEYSPEYMALRVNAQAEEMTVLNVASGFDWHATIDGRPAEVFQATGPFRGVKTPAGEHEIVLVCRPVWLYAGLGVSFAGLSLLSLLGVFTLVRQRLANRRRRRPAEQNA